MYKSLKKTKHLFLLLSNFYLCFSVYGCTKIEDKVLSKELIVHPPEVEVIKIKTTNLTNQLKATGSLESPQTTELTSEVAGNIIYINIPEGQLVDKGHVLAKVNDTTNLAEIDIAKAKLKNAQDNYNRMKSLKEQGAISQQTLDNSLEVLRVAEGEFNRASSVYSMTQIVAPFSGVLSIREISLGEYIDPGDHIVRISQTDPLYLMFSIPEQYISQIKVGQNIKFTLSDSTKEYTAKITVIDPYIDPSTRTVQIKATVPNSKRELSPGRFANINLEVSNIQNAISIPEEALIQEGNKKQVAVVSSKNTIFFKDVIISKWSRDSVLISNGLMIGDIIVTSGHQKIRPGSKIIPKPYNSIHNKILDKEINQ